MLDEIFLNQAFLLQILIGCLLTMKIILQELSILQ